MDINLQFVCLQKNGNMVKNTPFLRGDCSRVQKVNWIMAANELQHFSSSNSFSAYSPAGKDTCLPSTPVSLLSPW